MITAIKVLAMIAIYCFVSTSDYDALVRMDQERGTHYAQR